MRRLSPFEVFVIVGVCAILITLMEGFYVQTRLERLAREIVPSYKAAMKSLSDLEAQIIKEKTGIAP